MQDQENEGGGAKAKLPTGRCVALAQGDAIAATEDLLSFNRGGMSRAALAATAACEPGKVCGDFPSLAVASGIVAGWRHALSGRFLSVAPSLGWRVCYSSKLSCVAALPRFQ